MRLEQAVVGGDGGGGDRALLWRRVVVRGRSRIEEGRGAPWARATLRTTKAPPGAREVGGQDAGGELAAAHAATAERRSACGTKTQRGRRGAFLLRTWVLLPRRRQIIAWFACGGPK